MSKRNNKVKLNSGMTYVELIVVLSIFSVMSSIVLFNYSEFQSRVDIKNLSADIALKIVEAQKAALSGLIPIKNIPPTVPPWKPAYGIYFNTTNSNKSFVYFTDIDQNNFDSDLSFCNTAGPDNECISKIEITKGNYISDITVYFPSSSQAVTDFSLVFKRPNSGIVMYSNGNPVVGAQYAEITVRSTQGVTNKIRAYASGRIQVNQ
ncbi:MAG: type II secretion system protein [Candidatus Paceibacterota bacterium]|jgi:prepilin-type N-terminal cleavage/methylation domain-containing protein